MDAIESTAGFGGMTGENRGGATVQPGILGNAIFTNGTGPGVVVHGIPQGTCLINPSLCLNGLTLSVWVKFLTLTHVGNHARICLLSGDFVDGIYLETYNSHIRFRVNEFTDPPGRPIVHNSGVLMSTTVDTWYHFTSVWHPEKGMKVYINGELEVDKPPSTTLTPIERTGHIDKISIGGTHGGLEMFFAKCFIDDLYAWFEEKDSNFVVRHFSKYEY